MSRSALLDKLRRIQARSEAPPLPDGMPEFPAFEDPVARFAQELEAAGGVFLDGRGEEKLQASLSAALKACRATRIHWEAEEVFTAHPLPHRVRDPVAFQEKHLLFTVHHNQEVRFPLVLHSRPYRRKDVVDVELSVGGAAWGIAETGTVALQVSPGKGRLLSMLPPAHVALLSEKRLLMNAAQFFEAFQPGRQGSLLTLVTGPSRTADIQKTLVIGVHGPGRWFVVLTE